MKNFEYYELKLEPTHYSDECPFCGSLIDCASKSQFENHVYYCKNEREWSDFEPEETETNVKTNSNSQ